MHDDQLPVPPDGDSGRNLPANSDRPLQPAGSRALAVEMFDERKDADSARRRCHDSPGSFGAVLGATA